MKATRFAGIDDARGRIGQEVGITEWMQIDQGRIDGFAEVTGDHQWIHVDVERAKRESPFGAPIAHGYMTLSLLAKFAGECISVEGAKLAVNYGLNRVRFTSPVRVGSRLRGRFVLQAYQPLDGGAQLMIEATIEIEGQPKPACVAVSLTRRFTASTPQKG